MKTILILLGVLYCSHFCVAQATLGFENLLAQTFASPNCLYNDPDFTTSHTLQNFNAICGQIVVQAAPTSTELGFDIVWSPVGANAGSGFSDNDAFGVATSASLASETGEAAPEGVQGFVMEDTDGEVEMTFTSVDLSGTTNPQFSIQYILGATSWEPQDILHIYLDITGCAAATQVNLVNTTGIDIDGNFTEGSWVTLNADLTPYINCKAQLVLVNSTNAAAEELGIDNIIFTEGMVEGTPLPVDLLSFNAEKTDQGVVLVWETISEINHDYFSIERSFDGLQFTAIDKVNGLGSPDAYQRYTYLDDAPILNGTIYYRLKQVDFDGTTSYSKTLSMQVKENKNLFISPNPVNSELRIGRNHSRFQNWMVTDFFGRVIAKGPLNKDYIDVSYIPSGTYLFQIFNERESKTSRFVKQ